MTSRVKVKRRGSAERVTSLGPRVSVLVDLFFKEIFVLVRFLSASLPTPTVESCGVACSVLSVNLSVCLSVCSHCTHKMDEVFRPNLLSSYCLATFTSPFVLKVM